MINPAVDFGTSPHGLSAELPLAVQESPENSGHLLPTDPQARHGRAGLSTFSLTEVQREDLAFAALCQVESLEQGDEAHEPEVRSAILNLWAAYDALKGVQA